MEIANYDLEQILKLTIENNVPIDYFNIIRSLKDTVKVLLELKK